MIIKGKELHKNIALLLSLIMIVSIFAPMMAWATDEDMDYGVNDEVRLAMDKEALTAELIADENESLDKVSSNLNLTVTGQVYGSQIQWDTSKHSAINEDGSISPQEEDITGEITATISYAGISDKKVFNVAVLKKLNIEEPNIVTTLKDMTTKSEKVTFDLWVKDASGNKINTSDVVVTNNNEPVSVTWDDLEKTSYTLTLKNGENKVEINVNYNGENYIQKYTIIYEEVEDDEIIGKVTFSLEAFTIGLGHIIEPIQVDIHKGYNAAQELDKILTNNGYNYDNTGSLERNFYLSCLIDDTNTIYKTTPAIPEILKEKLNGFYDEKDYYEGELGEFNFNSMSGWMYSVNNVFPNVGFADRYLQDGDVMRVHFTLALGNDIGGSDSLGGSGSAYFPKVNKDELTAKIAEINSSIDKNEILSRELVKTAYDNAYAVLVQLDSTQDSVDAVLLELNNALEGGEEEKVLTVKEQLDKNLAFILQTVDNPTFGTGGGEWSVLSLARGEYPVPQGYYETYYNNVVDKVKKLMPASGSKAEGLLDRNKGTEHSRLILGLTSIGKDIRDVGGYDITEALGDFKYVTRQGINGPIFVLIALDSHNYEIKGADTQSIKEQCIDFILKNEIAGGGWALSGNNPDPDITAMAIQGLTPYYKRNTEVKNAVDRAITWLSNVQREDGDYASWGSVNSESTAQVIVALTGLDIDPHTDNRFIKNGNSAVDGLLSYAVAEGGFMHVKPGGNTGGGAAAGEVDGMATDQGTYALVAYDRFVKDKTPLYDMTDVEIQDSGTPEIPGDKIAPVITTNLADKTTDKSELSFTVNVEDDVDGKITPIVRLDNNVVLGSEGKYKVTLAEGKNIITITAIDKAGNKSEEIFVINYKIDTNTPGGGGGGEVTPPQDKKYITLSIDKKTIDMGYVLPPTKVEFKTGENVWDVLKREMDNRGIGYTYVWTEKYGSVYVEWIDGDGEFDHGSGSGWMYNVNGWYPNYGASKYALQDGDIVEWRYTTDLGADLGEDLSQWEDPDGNTSAGSSTSQNIVADSKNKAPTIEVPDDIEGDYTLNVTRKLDKTENITIKIPDVKHSVILNLDDVRYNIPRITAIKDSIEMIFEKGNSIKSGDDKIQLMTRVDKNDENIKELIEAHIGDENKKPQIKSAFIMGNTKDTVMFERLNTLIFKGEKDQLVGFIEKDKFTPIDIYDTEDAGRKATRSRYKQTFAFIEGNDLVVKSNHFTTFVSYNTNTAEEKVKDKAEPKENINLQAKYMDVDKISSWAYKAIARGTEKGFISGSSGNFNPKNNITRAEFTTIMVSVLDLDPNLPRANNFTDVNENDWFYKYVNTAHDAGIVSGHDNKFNPNTSITREEMAVIIRKALGLKDINPSTGIKDIKNVSSWARKDVETIVANRLMVGYDNEFNPKDKATREMAVVVLMKAYDFNNGQESTEVPTTKLDAKAEVKLEEKTKIESKHRDVKKTIEDTGRFMQKTITDPTVASVGGEWTVFSLARSHMEVAENYYNKYYANVEKTLKEKSGKLHPIKYTEYDRVILALTSIGKGIDDVAGYNLREPLADFETLIKQGINGPIFALIALDSNNYEIPVIKDVKTQTTKDLLIDFILQREIKGGGWALGENPPAADPDITAMAIQGLTPYYASNEKVRVAVDRGLDWLSRVQEKNGGYSSWGSINSESIAQVVVALTGLGIDPHNDPRFIKNGKSALDALLSFADAKGGFYHIKAGDTGNGGAEPGQVDAMATDQAMYALVAYDRFVSGSNRLYDMTDVKK